MTEQHTPLPIGPDQVAEATALLQKYKAGKAGLDQRILDNEQWFCMRHWKSHRNPMMEGKPQPASGWLFNSIANKHADAMDNYPEPCVLPRAADDEAAARTLSSILPVVLEQADYEQAYSDAWWRKLKQGTGVKGIFWARISRMNRMSPLPARPFCSKGMPIPTRASVPPHSSSVPW